MGDTDVDLYGEDLPEETGKSDSFKPFDVFSYEINDLQTIVEYSERRAKAYKGVFSHHH